MRVFLTGATGYIGRVIAQKLIGKGHQVTGLARSSQAGETLTLAGIDVFSGNLNDAKALAQGAQGADAVIHAAASRDPEGGQWEKDTVAALLGGLTNTDKRFIYTSGASVVGAAGPHALDETAPTDPDNMRAQLETEILNTSHVSAMIVRPSFVYGLEGGILPRYTTYALEQGIAGYVLPGDNTWSFIHVEDLADLYVAALEKGTRGAIYNGTAGAVPMITLAEAIRDTTGASLQGWTPEQAVPILGRIAYILGLNIHVSGERARRELDWTPTGISVYEEIGRLSAALR